MTDSRDAILASIRKNKPAPTELPDLNQDWIQYDDPVEKFREVLASVGGTLKEAGSLKEIEQQLPELVSEFKAEKVCSLVPGVNASNFDFDAVTDPHELEDVDLAILPGAFAVAENAAIWIHPVVMKHRTLIFITQHLVLAVPRSNLLHNLHQAYEQLEFNKREFGLFLSGPSKTADIEQSLVIGAHGSRSLIVYLYDENPLDDQVLIA